MIGIKRTLLLLTLICSLALSPLVQAYDVVNLPETITFADAMGIFDPQAITKGTVSNVEEGKYITLTQEQIMDFYYGSMDTTLHRTINPRPFSGLAVNLYTGNTVHTYFLESGVQIGAYGDSNYISYQMPEGNEITYALYSLYQDSGEKLEDNTFPINKNTDFLKLPKDPWAVEPAKKAARLSLLPYGFTGKYEKNITREEFCILLGNLIAVVNNYKSLDEYMLDRGMVYLRNVFTDCYNVDDSVYILHALGIVSGKTDTLFDPDAPVTREEAAKLLCETAEEFLFIESTYQLAYTDANSISPWAGFYVKWVTDKGVMTGMGDNTFAPKSNYTVQQAIATVNRLYDRIKK